MNKIKCNNLILDIKTGECLFSGKKIQFRPGSKMFEVLKCLMLHRNRRVSYQDLLLASEPDINEKAIIKMCPNGFKEKKLKISYLLRNIKRKIGIKNAIWVKNKPKKGFVLMCKVDRK